MSNTYTTLIELAERYIRIGQHVLGLGLEIVPVAVGMWPDGNIKVATIHGPSTAVQRASLLREFALDGADGVLFFGDINLRDAVTMQKLGDALHAFIELKDGRTAVRLCKYTPDPLVFEAITEPDRGSAMWIHPIYDRTVN
jgi:hypothetical protein